MCALKVRVCGGPWEEFLKWYPGNLLKVNACKSLWINKKWFFLLILLYLLLLLRLIFARAKSNNFLRKISPGKWKIWSKKGRRKFLKNIIIIIIRIMEEKAKCFITNDTFGLIISSSIAIYTKKDHCYNNNSRVVK